MVVLASLFLILCIGVSTIKLLSQYIYKILFLLIAVLASHIEYRVSA